MGEGENVHEPAIEFGIDGRGRKVSAEDAISGRTYKCYYCKEDIHVRRGTKIRAYFAHSPISNRTPQQMACEGYMGHGAGDRYIDNNEDRICIFNGGVPLHLVEAFPGKYELIAMFPPLSEKTMKLVENANGKIRVTNDGTEQVFSAWNFRRYRVKSLSNWIYVKPDNFKVFNEEMKRKWFWGFRGLDFENDLFRTDSNGGVRVGQLANISIGKEYLFVHRWGIMPSGKGLVFKKKGKFSFPNSFARTEYDVCSVTVTAMTDDAIKYIQQKGYQLIDKSDELIPMWPPAALEGKELIYHNFDREAYIYHQKESNQQVFYWGNSIPYQIMEKDNVIRCSTTNTTLLLSDYSFDALAKEIRFVLTHDRDNYHRARQFNYEAKFLMEDGRKVDITTDIYNEPFTKPILLETNYKTVAISVKGNCVVRSTSKRIDDLSKQHDIAFIFEPFGKYIVNALREENGKDSIVASESKAFNYLALVRRLYHCHSAQVDIPFVVDKWILHAMNNSEDLLKILLRWKNQGKMPIKAIQILKSAEELLT